MAVNVTEKDKTPNEIIDRCEQSAAEGPRPANAPPIQHDMAAYGVVKGQINAYEKTADHRRPMPGSPAPCRPRRRIKARTRNEQSNPICRAHPLRRDDGHTLRDPPALRTQTGCAQSATKGETCGPTQATTDRKESP